MVQWLRITLAMRGTLVQSLVQEDPTGHRATKLMCTAATEPVHWALQASTTELTCCNYRSPCSLELRSATKEATTVRSLCRGEGREAGPQATDLCFCLILATTRPLSSLLGERVCGFLNPVHATPLHSPKVMATESPMKTPHISLS